MTQLVHRQPINDRPAAPSPKLLNFNYNLEGMKKPHDATNQTVDSKISSENMRHEVNRNLETSLKNYPIIRVVKQLLDNGRTQFCLQSFSETLFKTKQCISKKNNYD